jgi:hypothetical protein
MSKKKPPEDKKDSGMHINVEGTAVRRCWLQPITETLEINFCLSMSVIVSRPYTEIDGLQTPPLKRFINTMYKMGVDGVPRTQERELSRRDIECLIPLGDSPAIYETMCAFQRACEALLTPLCGFQRALRQGLFRDSLCRLPLYRPKLSAAIC